MPTLLLHKRWKKHEQPGGLKLPRPEEVRYRRLLRLWLLWSPDGYVLCFISEPEFAYCKLSHDSENASSPQEANSTLS